MLSSCQECTNLKSYLRRKGVQLSITHISTPVVQTYPTVVYSNNTADYGERIYQGRCTLPKTLSVMEIE
jgi:hypothetical protein